jgi:hypothetical protein
MDFGRERNANYIFPQPIDYGPRNNDVGAAFLLLGALNIEIFGIHPIDLALLDIH